MRPFLISAALTLTVLATGCTNTDNPQLAMCQAVTKQLTSNTVSSWDNTDQSDSGTNRVIKIDYTSASDEAGTADCHYKILADGTVETSPVKVVLNGQPIGSKELVTAGTKATGELLKGTAANTVAKSRELANEAGQAASEIAGKAQDAASDAAKTLQDTLDK